MKRAQPEQATRARQRDESAQRRSGRSPGRRRAAGIYGTIVTAAVIATAGGRLPAISLSIAVVVTLLVYWLAEQYAELLGEHTHAGKLPTVAQVRSSLRATWPMVSSSYLPVASLLLARLLGASVVVAAYVGLAMAIVLLLVYGWKAGRASKLRGIRQISVTLLAAALGAAMVALKVGLQH